MMEFLLPVSIKPVTVLVVVVDGVNVGGDGDAVGAC